MSGIDEAWAAAWAEMPEIKKSSKVDTGKFKYQYASLDSILASVKPVLVKHGLSVTQNVLQENANEVRVYTTIWHTSGESMGFGPVVMMAGNDPKQVGSAITYARRYGLSAALGIASEEDDDAQSHTPQERVFDDPHDLAWRNAIRLFGDQAEVQFLAALKGAGVKTGKRATAEQAVHVDQILRQALEG